MKRFLVLSISLFSFCAASAQADTTSAPGHPQADTVAAARRQGVAHLWTLRQCIDYAIENNIDVRQIELSVENSQLDLNTARNSRLPNLSAGVSQNFNFGQSPVREFAEDTGTWTDVYRDTQTSNTSLSVSSSVPLFSGFRISNQIKGSEIDLKAAFASLEKARQNIELQVTSLYLDVLFKKEILKAYEDQAALTREHVERTQTLVEAGRVPRSQYYDALAQLADDETNVVTSSNDTQMALLNLSQALNLVDPDGFDVLVPDPDRATADMSSLMYTPDEIYAMAVETKPHVAEAEYNLQSSVVNKDIAKADFWPSLSLGLGYGNSYYYAFGADNMSFNKQLRKQGNESIGLSLSIPIFNRMATRNRVRAAALTVDSRRLELDNVKLSISKEVRQAHQSAVAAQARLVSAGRAYDAAKEAYEYAQERYGVGKSTVFELNDAQTKLLTSRSSQLQAKYDFVFRLKILDFYRGVPINIAY